MTNRDGNAITWFSHNRPKKIHYGTSSSEFWYGADRSRYKHVAISGGSTVTTRYFGPHFEVETRGTLTIYRHYVFANGQAVAQYERRSSGTPANDIQYLHRDHLSSVVATTNAAGSVRQRFEFDAFGLRSRSFGSGADDTERGYTGHEHLDAVALTHMNGRVQDPELGRFISADPFVQAPYNSQSLNRYSYVWNNPLNLTDPSGFQSCPYDRCDPIRVPSDECKLRNYDCADTGVGIACFEAFSCWADRADVADTSGFVFGLVDDTPQGRFIGLLDQWASHLVSQAPQWRLAIDDFSEGGGFPGFYAGRVVQEFVLEPVQGASTAWIERDAVAGGVAVVGAVFKPVRAADKLADAGASYFDDLVAGAQRLYPRKAGRIEQHHIEPLYLGGARSGTTAPLDASYHQLITNEFRRLAPYGAEVPSPGRVQEIMRQVYQKYPLPPGY